MSSHFSHQAIFKEASAPATPATGYVAVYAKADGVLYFKDDAGTETAAGGGGSSADNYSIYITGLYTGAAGARILADTSATGFTLVLPAAPVTGDTLYVIDAKGTWGSNNLTISGGGNRIFSETNNLTCDISGAAIKLYYVSTGIGYNVFYG